MATVKIVLHDYASLLTYICIYIISDAYSVLGTCSK